MIEAIVLSDDRPESTEIWQKAIDSTGYGLELNTPIPIECLDGYVSVRWKKNSTDRNHQKSGFECRHTRTDIALSEAAFSKPSTNYSYAFALGWSEDPIAKITVRIAAAAYALAAAGIVLLRDKGLLLPDEVLRQVRDQDEYEWLPRKQATALQSNKRDAYEYNERPKTTIHNVGATKLHEMKNAEYAVLVGRNNSGKSFVLKALTEHWGKNASYLGPARYQNFNLLPYYTPTENKQEAKWKQFSSHWSDDSQNIDNSPLNLQQAIAELSNDKRASLKSIAKSLLGVQLDFCFTAPENDMSQKYVSCNGHNISFTSSGLRLVITIITSLLDDSHDLVLIDEPELGISPEAQGILADFLLDRGLRQRHFPHIKTLILATHSTIFLDSRRIQNNFIVDKLGDVISIKQIEEQREFNKIHFFLLGNRFETLYLPSVIFLVEGKSDRLFIERALSLRYPNSRFSVIAANNDSQIKHYLHTTKTLLNNIQKSPYQDRLFVILDSQHAPGLPQEIGAMGIPPENVVEWSRNGIEYVYPDELVDNIFGKGAEIAVVGDRISRNGITLSKVDLAEAVCSRMRPETTMSPEFQQKLLDRLDAIMG